MYIIGRTDRNKIFIPLLDFSNRPKRFETYQEAKEFLLRNGVPHALIDSRDYRIQEVNRAA